MPEPTDLRTDLFLTTALDPTSTIVERALALSEELNAPYVPRQDLALPRLFALHPTVERALVVQSKRLLLLDPSGNELFYHPNMSFLRLGNVLRGRRDLLLTVTDLRPGDSVLDATIGYAAEAILCAHAVGETGEVHGIESVPELGALVREGMQTISTDLEALNQAMRRIRMVHLGHHLEYLRTCPDDRYDVVCFDPFFEQVIEGSEHMMQPLRLFGDTRPLLPEALAEAQRVARRRVIVKSPRSSPVLRGLGITEIIGSRSGKVVYGVLKIDEK